MSGPGRPQRDLIEVLPEVLGHHAEGTEVSRTKVVKTRVAIVWIGAKSLKKSGKKILYISLTGMVCSIYQSNKMAPIGQYRFSLTSKTLVSRGQHTPSLVTFV